MVPGDRSDPWRRTLDESLLALGELYRWMVNPVIDGFGVDRLQLTYGLYSGEGSRVRCKSGD